MHIYERIYVLFAFHGAYLWSDSTPWRRMIYSSPDFITTVHLQPESWLAWRSSQYRKALRDSFPPDRWPATEITEPDGTVRFLLKDGVEVHRIGPPTEVYDYDTGKLIGRVGPRGSGSYAK